MSQPATRLLLVDDDEPLLEELGEGLRAYGFRVDTCTSAREALARVAAAPDIAVVITDVVMPECDGLRLVGELSRMGGPPAVVLFTAHATLDLVIAALRIKVADFLHKPVAPEEVAAAVGRVAKGLADPARRDLGEGAAAAPAPPADLPGLEFLIGQIEDRDAAFGTACFRNERWVLLLRLAAAPPEAAPRLRDLAVATGFGSRTVRRALLELASLGLVEEGQDRDRRRRTFRLTAAARQRLKRLLARLPPRG